MNWRPLLLLLVGLLGGAAIFSGAVRAQARLDPAAIDAFISREMKAQRVPGLALAVTRSDDVLYLKGYGSEGGRPVTPQTQFHIASLSKGMTAVAVLQLVDAGRLELDAPVQRYLPEFALADAEAASRVTIRHLLNQTSGLADAGFPELRLPQPATIEERVTSLHAARPVAPPGNEFHYFNPNYAVLARVVEVVSGRDFSDYLQENLFAPLGMTSTVSVVTSAEAAMNAGRLAQGHLLAFGIPVASPEESGYLAGSGGVISTAADMARYLLMQLNGGRFRERQLLSGESVALMRSPPGAGSDYGMGWFITTVEGHAALEHNGILSTFYAEALLLPEAGYGFVLLYPVHSVTQEVVAFPRFKAGVAALLTGSAPPEGGLSAGLLGYLLAAITLLGVALAVRSLLRFPAWARRACTVPAWRHLPGILLSVAPLLLLLALPTLVLAFSGRAFGYVTLFRAMVGVMTWLTLVGVLGAVNGVARAVVVVRCSL